MIFILLGLLAFLLFYIYDINSVLWNNTILRHSFFAGCLLFAVSAAGIIRDAYHICSPLSPLNKGALAVSAFLRLLLSTHCSLRCLSGKCMYILEAEAGKSAETVSTGCAGIRQSSGLFYVLFSWKPHSLQGSV